jgi:hypothetical protein
MVGWGRLEKWCVFLESVTARGVLSARANSRFLHFPFDSFHSLRVRSE